MYVRLPLYRRVYTRGAAVYGDGVHEPRQSAGLPACGEPPRRARAVRAALHSPADSLRHGTPGADELYSQVSHRDCPCCWHTWM